MIPLSIVKCNAPGKQILSARLLLVMHSHLRKSIMHLLKESRKYNENRMRVSSGKACTDIRLGA